jgi:hypothetical protein
MDHVHGRNNRDSSGVCNNHRQADTNSHATNFGFDVTVEKKSVVSAVDALSTGIVLLQLQIGNCKYIVYKISVFFHCVASG